LRIKQQLGVLAVRVGTGGLAGVPAHLDDLRSEKPSGDVDFVDGGVGDRFG
jgi:hypothetical protein